MEIVEPTKQQKEKFSFEPPILDQKNARPGWRKKWYPEKLYGKGDIDHQSYQAAKHFELLALTAAGHDTRWCDERVSTGPNDSYCKRSAAGSELAQLERAMTGAVWRSLNAVILAEQRLEDLGGCLRPYIGTRSTQRGYALAMLQVGLDVVSDICGLVPGNRKSAA